MIDQNKANTRNSVVKSSFIVGGMTFISRVSGFIRDIIFANVFGASSNTDAFFVAFKIPNFFRRLFAEGAFIQSFVPILNEYKTTKPLEVKKLISYIQGNLGLILFFITLLGIVFSENIINIFDDFKNEKSRNLGIRINTRSYSKTYSEDEVSNILNEVVEKLETKFSIKLNKGS